jgi:hypothetical protein
MSFILRLLQIKNELDKLIENNREKVEDENKTSTLMGAPGLHECNSWGDIEESDFGSGSLPTTRHRSAQGLSNHKWFSGYVWRYELWPVQCQLNAWNKPLHSFNLKYVIISFVPQIKYTGSTSYKWAYIFGDSF